MFCSFCLFLSPKHARGLSDSSCEGRREVPHVLGLPGSGFVSEVLKWFLWTTAHILFVYRWNNGQKSWTSTWPWKQELDCMPALGHADAHCVLWVVWVPGGSPAANQWGSDGVWLLKTSFLLTFPGSLSLHPNMWPWYHLSGISHRYSSSSS